jgi:hypothetical protein
MTGGRIAEVLALPVRMAGISLGYYRRRGRLAARSTRRSVR